MLALPPNPPRSPDPAPRPNKPLLPGERAPLWVRPALQAPASRGQASQSPVGNPRQPCAVLSVRLQALLVSSGHAPRQTPPRQCTSLPCPEGRNPVTLKGFGLHPNALNTPICVYN